MLTRLFRFLSFCDVTTGIKKLFQEHDLNYKTPLISTETTLNKSIISLRCLTRVPGAPKNLPLSTNSHDPLLGHCWRMFPRHAPQPSHVPQPTVSSSNEHTCNRIMPLVAWLLLVELSWRGTRSWGVPHRVGGRSSADGYPTVTSSLIWASSVKHHLKRTG